MACIKQFSKEEEFKIIMKYIISHSIGSGVNSEFAITEGN